MFLVFSHPLFFCIHMMHHTSDTLASELCTWLVQSATSSTQIQHAYDQTHHRADESSERSESALHVHHTQPKIRCYTQNLIVR